VAIENHWVTERNGLVYVTSEQKPQSRRRARTLFLISSWTIKSLQPGPALWSIRGKVLERGDVREIETKEGRRTRVSNIDLRMIVEDTGQLLDTRHKGLKV